jgi:hypothetical protein
VTGELRLRAFRAAQSFLAQRRALILFDEVEDVFDDGNDLLVVDVNYPDRSTTTILAGGSGE